ncbi:MAG: hypothetical protein WCV86_03970 [Patescibacteria group bacterium]|jgi:type IV secretory pathway VirB4 component
MERKLRKPKQASTQEYLRIQEIKDDVVVMKDGSLRGVLLVASVNFALKSDDEQIAVIQSYTQFLNALTFPLQIVIQSRKLNVDEYLNRLREVEKAQTNDLLKMQTAEYVQYIKELVEIADIMSKRFYVVVPFYPGENERTPAKFFGRFFQALSPTSIIHLKQKQFIDLRTELMKRIDYIIEGLSESGLKSVLLNTQSLIELYYNTYNPEVYSQEQLLDVSKIQID